MWSSHLRSLGQQQGKSYINSAISIDANLNDPAQGDVKEDKSTGRPRRESISVAVSVPQSKFEYHPLEPPIIETPQLRDMGEATPPLEWVGLHRDRLPNVTHQIVIVSLLEVAKEAQDAYERILGTSST